MYLEVQDAYPFWFNKTAKILFSFIHNCDLMNRVKEGKGFSALGRKTHENKSEKK